MVLALMLCGPLADAKDDELCGFHHGDAYKAYQAPVVDVALGDGGAVALNKECLLRLVALQRSRPPDTNQKA